MKPLRKLRIGQGWDKVEERKSSTHVAHDSASMSDRIDGKNVYEGVETSRQTFTPRYELPLLLACNRVGAFNATPGITHLFLSCRGVLPSNSLFNLPSRKYDRKAPPVRDAEVQWDPFRDRFARHVSVSLFLRIPPISFSIEIALLRCTHCFIVLVFWKRNSSFARDAREKAVVTITYYLFYHKIPR